MKLYASLLIICVAQVISLDAWQNAGKQGAGEGMVDVYNPLFSHDTEHMNHVAEGAKESFAKDSALDRTKSFQKSLAQRSAGKAQSMLDVTSSTSQALDMSVGDGQGGIAFGENFSQKPITEQINSVIAKPTSSFFNLSKFLKGDKASKAPEKLTEQNVNRLNLDHDVSGQRYIEYQAVTNQNLSMNNAERNTVGFGKSHDNGDGTKTYTYEDVSVQIDNATKKFSALLQ